MNLERVKNELYNKRTGIINIIYKVDPIVGGIPLHTVTAKGNLVINENKDIIVNCDFLGAGFDFDSIEMAEIGAIGEFVERYSSTVVNANILEGSYKELVNKGINPLDPFTVTRTTKADLKKYKKNGLLLTEETEFCWVKGIDELANTFKWIPSELVYQTPFFKNPLPIRDMISTGLATGNSLHDAKERGLLECLERDAIVIMWQCRVPFPRVKLESITDEDVQKIIESIKRLGLDLIVSKISNDIDIPIYFASIKSKYKPYLSVGANAHFDKRKALIGAIKEAVATYNLNIYNTFKKEEETRIIDTENIEEMEEHSYYYSKNKIENAIEFLEKGEYMDYEKDEYSIKNYVQLLVQLKKIGVDYLSVDLTTIDLKTSDLYVVRSICPQLAFLEGSSIPMRNCERLTSVPKKMGFEVGEYNEMIHPFP